MLPSMLTKDHTNIQFKCLHSQYCVVKERLLSKEQSLPKAPDQGNEPILAQMNRLIIIRYPQRFVKERSKNQMKNRLRSRLLFPILDALIVYGMRIQMSRQDTQK